MYSAGGSVPGLDPPIPWKISLNRDSKWSNHEIPSREHHRQLTNDVVGALQNLFGTGHVDGINDMHHI